MRTLIAPTEDFIKREMDTVNADVSAGTAVAITVQSSANLAVNDYIIVGKEGSETAEIALITEITSLTAIKATLVLAHKKGEPITKIRYNKRKFYGSLTASGVYAEISGSPVTIMVNNPQGTIIEYTGGDGYVYFKSTYYNSTTADETSAADADAVNSDDSLRYTTLYAIRVQAGLTKNPYIDDGRIERKRIQAENEINSAIYRLYELPLDEIPPLIQRLCELLAAGYVDFEEYGPDGQGVKWLGEARGILKSIKEGTQNLIGEDGTELDRKTLTQGIVSYPDSVDNNNGPVRNFTMRQRF